MSTPIVTGNFVIQKMNIKGGWCYVLLPKQAANTSNPFGWYIVKGSIDDYIITQYKLWPTKAGEWFLPIKTEIRKKIHKQVGDTVNIVLYTDNSEVKIPNDFLICLEDYPLAKTFFNNLSATSQKQFIDHIYSSKNVMAQANRMASAFKKMEQGKKWHQK